MNTLVLGGTLRILLHNGPSVTKTQVFLDPETYNGANASPINSYLNYDTSVHFHKAEFSSSLHMVFSRQVRQDHTSVVENVYDDEKARIPWPLKDLADPHGC